MMHIIHYERCTSFDMNHAHHLNIETAIHEIKTKKEKIRTKIYGDETKKQFAEISYCIPKYK